jgi:hypothetical protein
MPVSQTSQVPGRSSKSRNSEGYTTAMDVLQREVLGADGILANDSVLSSPVIPPAARAGHVAEFLKAKATEWPREQRCGRQRR